MPLRPLYKSEAIVVLVRALYWDQWSLQADLQKANSEWIVKDIVNIYRPVTRFEISLMLYRARNKILNSETNNLNNSWDLTNANWENSWISDNNSTWLSNDTDLAWLLNSFGNDEDTNQTTSWDNQTVSWDNQTASWDNQTTSWDNQTASWDNQITSWDNQTASWDNQTITWDNQAVTTATWDSQTAKITKKIIIEKIYSDRLIPVADNLYLYKVKFDWLTSWDKYKLEQAKIKINWLVDRSSIKSVFIADKNNMVISNEREFNSNFVATINSAYAENNEITNNNNELILWINVNDIWNKTQQFNLNVELTFDKNLDNTELTWNAKNEVLDKNEIKFSTDTEQISNYISQVLDVQWYNMNWDVYVWDTALVWEFRVSVWNWNSTKDVRLDRIILYNEWSKAEWIVNNVILKDSKGKIVAMQEKVIWDYVVLKFKNNYILTDWETEQFKIYADIVWWDNNDTIKFTLDNNRDLIWYEAEWNKNSLIPARISFMPTDNFWVYNVKAWKIIISKSSLSPTPDNIPVNDSSTILKFNIHAPQQITTDSLKATLYIENTTSTSITLNKVLDDVTLYSCDENYSNCTSLWTFNKENVEIPANSSKTITIKNDIWEIKKWNNNFEIRVKVSRYAPDGTKIKIKIDNNSLENPENINWNTIDANDINWVADSWIFTAKTASVQIAYNNPYGLLEFVKWAKWISFGEYKITPTVTNVNLNSLEVKLEKISWPDVLFNNIQAKLYVDWVLEDTETVQAEWTYWTILFNKNISFVKDTTSTIEIKIDTDTSLYTWNSDLKLRIELPSANKVLFTTENWLQLPNNKIVWTFPIISSPAIIYPTAKVLLMKDNSIVDGQIIYWNNYYNVFTFKIKPKYDNIKLQDLYIVAYSWST